MHLLGDEVGVRFPVSGLLRARLGNPFDEIGLVYIHDLAAACLARRGYVGGVAPGASCVLLLTQWWFWWELEMGAAFAGRAGLWG